MPSQLHILAAGNSPKSVTSLVGGNFSDGGLTAAGTNKATSLVLPGYSNYISVCSSGKGASLPPSLAGDGVEVYNGGSNALLIYTPVGVADTITTGSANGGFTVSANKGCLFRKTTSSLWMVNYSK